MVNIVTMNRKRHLVDVAFGSNSPLRPVPLESGIVFDGVGEQKGKLEYRTLAQHSDKDQRIWVYSIQERRQAPWKEQYCFMDIEFFPADFEVMNLSTMTSPRGLFVKTLVASMVLLDDEGKPCGKVTLNHDYLRIRKNGEDNTAKLETEEDRMAALEKHFGIHLSAKEREAIRGLPSELKHKAPGADF
jgi:arylamine N-acetyltransferase